MLFEFGKVFRMANGVDSQFQNIWYARQIFESGPICDSVKCVAAIGRLLKCVAAMGRLLKCVAAIGRHLKCLRANVGRIEIWPNPKICLADYVV